MPDSVKPPRTASLLLTLFSGEPDFTQIHGDLIEEFHQRVRRLGPRHARAWYTREVFRNVRSLMARPRLISTVGAAALSVAVIRLTARPFFHWLQLELASAPRMVGLGWTLRAVFEVTVSGIVGFTMGSVSSGRGPVLRATFSAFFLLWLAYWVVIRGYVDVWLADPIRGPLDAAESFLIVAGFYAGSLGAERLLRRHYFAVRPRQ
ncbi:MAG: hypothetical protein A3H96_21100 [Acidobacteria bacterium RIFCSPLOWO2_02_FULL_67_36]|nr:MAG: hypothetical protein A3H96_21100 [Acidobacteria bacterium RIFCSPLOWO2_02_FULL_67_36]OFW21928.1 MAG: hypothetical protein A3G21_08670 [Acidobacteria bacterium RIFCSPLOWO2_12_FULL_66_21]